MAVYPADGCVLVTRNTFGGFSSPQGTEGGWRMTAPAGATIADFSLNADLKGTAGWDAAVFDNGGKVYIVCPGGLRCEGTNQTFFNGTGAPLAAGTTQLITRVRCYASSCTNTGDSAGSPERGKLVIRGSTMTVADGSPPAARIAGGTGATGGWKGGDETLTIDASDNVGIRQYEAYVDGTRIGTTDQAGCTYAGRAVPCPNGAGTVALRLGELADGQHTLAGRAIDSADNGGDTASQTLSVDNHPPVSPQNPTIDGGPGWRTSKTRTVRWTNPSERYAPIVRARYELCPAAV